MKKYEVLINKSRSGYIVIEANDLKDLENKCILLETKDLNDLELSDIETNWSVCYEDAREVV